MRTSDTNVDLDQEPDAVHATLAFFRRQQLWHRVSRNSPATSCRDAAARRRRLGSEGMPLYDELKSLCVVVYRGDERRHALLHCRANTRFDLKAAARVLKATRPLARLSGDELEREFHCTYGTVNPFGAPGRFVQVFDDDVLTRYTPPYTMMTNAGDHTWAVEFRPPEVTDALQLEGEVHVAPIATRHRSAISLPSFGIITGNGPESGIALWRHLNDAVFANLSPEGKLVGDLSYPRVLIHSIPEMGLSMELGERTEEVWSVIADAVDQLCEAGARYLALACNTTQYFAERIRERAKPHGAEFVSMAEVVMEEVRRREWTDLTIIGIPVVADLGPYSAYRPLASLGLRPVREAARAQLQELGYVVKRLDRGEKDSRALNLLRNVLRNGVETQGVLVALTEISILLQRFPKLLSEIEGKSVVDSLRLYGEALARLYLDALPEIEEETEA
jgi:aspartate/glutamate racemase/prolyl-tRNA editing enzyme YbaK/EbsC (Cys-tRNA(Pro) deacylase)